MRAVMCGLVRFALHVDHVLTQSNAHGPDLDNTPRSLLLVQGGTAVHALFDFLYTECDAKLFADLDAPLLVAPTPFPGGCKAQATVRVTAAVDGAAGKLRAEVGGAGALPPWTVDQVC